MTTKILAYSFYLLFAVTPLVWAPWNFELFEYNKMMFVYLLALIIAASWIFKMLQTKTLILKSTPLDKFLLIFLLANVLSTIFSIDKHLSIWGYYSRSNGGLLSIISYLTLYFALVSNFDKEQVFKFLKASLLGGLLVSLWAIPEHFGVSLSCIILTGQFDASCWVQDVQARVFASLGQPNWLAAYLAMLIFPAFYFLLTSVKRVSLIFYSCSLILLYLAFTFTYSRGAALGLLAGMVVFVGIIIWQVLKLHPRDSILNQVFLKTLVFIIAAFIFINLFFGSALTDFKLVSKFAPPARPSLAINTPKPSTTQLESGGTESGAIRFIVWKGALEIFRHYPIFGSGVETFAESYYQFRPQEHNLVSEWDFLYNKAHNEFLNYLATTGILGFTSYIAIILAFIVFCIKGYVLIIMGKNKQETHSIILIPIILASYTTYLVQNFFSFSVVIIALFFYLFPAIVFVATDSAKPLHLPSLIHNTFPLSHFFYRRSIYPKIAKTAVCIIFGLLIWKLFNYYQADILFSEGNKADDSGNPGRAYNKLTQAVALNPSEPYYRSELGYVAASAALALEGEDATISSKLKNQAALETEVVLTESPHNVSFYRTAIRTYFLLSSLDKSFTQKTLDMFNKAIDLAPTDAKLYYNKAIILGQVKKNAEAIKTLEKAVKLKSNYWDASYSLGLFYFEQGEKEKAIQSIQQALKIIPNEPQSLEKLKEWQK